MEASKVVLVPSKTTTHPAPHRRGHIGLSHSHESQDKTPHEQDGSHFLPDGNGSALAKSQGQPQPGPSFTRKRAKKAPTMSAKKWRPAESMIRQLYLHDEKSIKELRDIVNEKFELVANERQYKSKIKQMALERYTKASEREAIVRHVHHRKYVVGKYTRLIRVRGRKITTEKLSRWTTEVATDVPPMLPDSLPQPSEICSDPLVEPQLPCTKLTTDSDMRLPLLQSALVNSSKHVIESQEAGSVFNDLQILLDPERNTREDSHGHQLNPAVEQDIVLLQNLMNITRRIVVYNEREAPGARVIYDLTSHPGSSAQVTYQAMIPNDSEIFRIVSNNQVGELSQALEKRTVRLADRDEDGRSLLSVRRHTVLAICRLSAELYAVYNGCAEMCRFLLSRNADPNAIELGYNGCLG
ncbi:MAG: hypothetical protein Q9160_007021 [Pyrenula sp. 1 TL-2023]